MHRRLTEGSSGVSFPCSALFFLSGVLVEFSSACGRGGAGGVLIRGGGAISSMTGFIGLASAIRWAC